MLRLELPLPNDSREALFCRGLRDADPAALKRSGFRAGFKPLPMMGWAGPISEVFLSGAGRWGG